MKSVGIIQHQTRKYRKNVGVVLLHFFLVQYINSESKVLNHPQFLEFFMINWNYFYLKHNFVFILRSSL